MVLFGVYEWTQPQLKKVYPTDSVFDTAFGLLKPQFLQIWGRTNPTYVSMHIYTNMYIYIYIHTQHMYISEYVYSGFNPSQNLKTMSQMELLIPCRIGCASFNSFDQWGAFPIHHRFTYTLIFNEYHSGVTRMISTIVRPNIYWIYTYIYISIYLYQWIMTLGCQDIPSRKSLFAAALRKPGRPLGSDPLLCQTYQIAFAWLT